MGKLLWVVEMGVVVELETVVVVRMEIGITTERRHELLYRVRTGYI